MNPIINRGLRQSLTEARATVRLARARMRLDPSHCTCPLGTTCPVCGPLDIAEHALGDALADLERSKAGR